MFIRILTYLIILMLLLSGCGKPSLISQDTKTPDAIQDPAQKAKQLEIQGHYDQAALEYLQLAEKMRPPTQQGYQLSAINAFLKADKIEKAKTELNRLNVEQSYGLAIPIEFVRIKIDLEEQRVNSALKRLKGINPVLLPKPEQIKYHQLQAETLVAQNQVTQALHQLAKMDEISRSEPELAQESAQSLWQTLLSFPLADLEDATTQFNDPIFSGWIALALVQKLSQNQHLMPALNNWRLRFPNHPALQGIVPGLAQNLSPSPIQKIALLLPLTGKFGAFAQAVQEGFSTRAQVNNKPPVMVYDVNQQNILAVYQQVVEQEVDFIVGPLEKQALEKLASSRPHLPIPTLGLNHLENPVSSGNLYQFALAPEDEAQEVAKYAIIQGQRSALVLVPDGHWGERVLEAFKKEWEQKGGQVVEQVLYDRRFKSAIPRTLKQIKGVDMVFLVAFPKIGRKIRPLLKTYLQNALPIYSTSHIYSGFSEPNHDIHLDGITFLDQPWVLAPNEEALQLRQRLQQSVSDDRLKKYTRLYGLGFDAFLLLSKLQSLSQSEWQGQTGRLSLDKNGFIHRDQLRWAHFENGVAQLID